MRIPEGIAPVSLLAVFSISLASCAARVAADTGQAPAEVHTAAARTLATATRQVTPTASLAATAGMFPTAAAFAISTPYPTSSGAASLYETDYFSSGGCDNAAYISDVTFEDGAEVAPGETFTKTWKFLNSGSCDWNRRYSIVFVGGSMMDGSETRIERRVRAGGYGEISVTLTAPEAEGTYTGYWTLANAGGAPFGEQVYVTIVVSEAAARSTATPTSEKSTSAPEVSTA